jgi:hypothetical protein
VMPPYTNSLRLPIMLFLVVDVLGMATRTGSRRAKRCRGPRALIRPAAGEEPVTHHPTMVIVGDPGRRRGNVV